MSEASTHILIVNQHGDNRGDEAALRAMLRAFTEKLGDVRFTVVHQSRDRELKLSFEEEVQALPMILKPLEAVGFALYGLLRRLGIKLRWLLSPTTRATIEAYESCDLVVSAPGGPYFGDLYRNHELVHWFYVWLAGVHGKKSFLYATSAGPFRTPVLNTIRRRLFRCFDGLCVREETSASLLRGLLGPEPEIPVTADSALQSRYPPWEPGEYFQGERAPLAERFLVASTALQYAFPEMGDRSGPQARYEEALLETLTHLAGQRDCHFLFFPQLYGDNHADRPFLEAFAGQLPTGTSWEIVDPELDSAMHQRLIAMCDFSIACRYHPQIFAGAGAVPGLCIYYEHKAASFMEVLGLSHLAFSIREPDAEAWKAGIDRALETHGEVKVALETGVAEQRKKARRTTELALELLPARPGASKGGSS